MPGSMTSSTTTSKAAVFSSSSSSAASTGLDHLHFVALGFEIETQAVSDVLLVFHYEECASFPAQSC